MAGYEYRHHTLCGSAPLAEQIAEIERCGWALVELYAPHYGALFAIGIFRRSIAVSLTAEHAPQPPPDDPSECEVVERDDRG